MSGPSYLLAACPVCSSPPRREHSFAGRFERPNWVYAHRTSEKRKERCYLWVGCAHAIQAAPNATRDPQNAEGCAAVEKLWAEAVPRLLAEKTARWTEAQRAEFARALEDRPYQLGASVDNPPTTHETTNNEIT